MKINTNKITFKYLKWLYDWREYTLPISLCQYFWHFIWGIICLPLCFIPFFLKKKSVIIWQVWPIFSIIFLFAGDLTYNKLFGFTFNIFLAIPLSGLIIASILAIVIALIVFLLQTFEILIYPKENIIKEFFKAQKQKICPLIEYTEQDSKEG